MSSMASAAQIELPDEPLVTIEPGKTLSILYLRELWTHRELLYFLTWRDLKVRYKQTVLGVAWVVMQPLMMTLIFTVFLLAPLLLAAVITTVLFIYALYEFRRLETTFADLI